MKGKEVSNVCMQTVLTMKSLLTIPSNKEGLIQPSVTSQPPRFTALTRKLGSVLPYVLKIKLQQMIRMQTTFLVDKIDAIVNPLD